MDLLVSFGSTRYRAFTLLLATRSSLWDLIGNSNLVVGVALNMLSALISSEYSYSAMQQVATTDTLEVRSPRSSRTKGKSTQNS